MNKTLTLNIFLVAITVTTFITYFLMAKNFNQIITGTNLYLTLGICAAFALAGANLILNDKPATAPRNHAATTTNPTTEDEFTLKFAEMHRATLQREKEITERIEKIAETVHNWDLAFKLTPEKDLVPHGNTATAKEAT